MRMPSSHRILHQLCRSLGLNLTQFTQYDENAWTEVKGVKLRNYVVEKMPEKLGYDLNHRERGHSPEDIYQMALNKAIKDVKVLGCKKAMNMFSEHTLLVSEARFPSPVTRDSCDAGRKGLMSAPTHCIGIPPQGGQPVPAGRAAPGRCDVQGRLFLPQPCRSISRARLPE